MTGLRLHDPRIDPSDPADAGAMVLGGARAQTPRAIVPSRVVATKTACRAIALHCQESTKRTKTSVLSGAEDGQLHAAPPLAEEPPLGTWGTPPLGRAGTLALWPGGIVHSVPKHKGAGRRVSIAFNVGITMRAAPAVGASEEECGNMLSGALSPLYAHVDCSLSPSCIFASLVELCDCSLSVQKLCLAERF